MANRQLEVLVADRDEETCSALATFLRGQGVRVTELADPTRAPSELRGGPYRMVLLDVGGPAGLGVRLLREIRSRDADLCVICTTDVPDVDTAVATMKHRAFDYLKKPLVLEELQPVIQAAIREHGLALALEDELNEKVGSCIRDRRHQLGLTLKQVANRTGLSVSLISQIELGKSAASLSTLHKVSGSLQVPMASFFERL